MNGAANFLEGMFSGGCLGVVVSLILMNCFGKTKRSKLFIELKKLLGSPIPTELVSYVLNETKTSPNETLASFVTPLKIGQKGHCNQWLIRSNPAKKDVVYRISCWEHDGKMLDMSITRVYFGAVELIPILPYAEQKIICRLLKERIAELKQFSLETVGDIVEKDKLTTGEKNV